jgi:hypothetical protein
MRLAALAVAIIVFDGFVLTDGHFDLLRRVDYGLTFNSMLLHLLAGRFDVDPWIVRNEGFLRDGLTYSYFGILPALLRLPLLLWPGGMRTDITGLSCLAALAVSAVARLRTLALLHRHCPATPNRNLLVAATGAWLLLAGAQTGFLRVSIYQEVLFWTLAMASVFLYAAMRGLLAQRFSPGMLAVMAAMAGLALLTRVSTALGLWIALGLLVLVLLRQGYAWRGLLAPLAILVACGAVAAGINLARWGNALTFADYAFYLGNAEYPDRLPRLRQYGLFNLARLPLGLVYYFLPVWVVPTPEGPRLLAGAFRRLTDVAELPPASFLLTDALPLLLMALLPRLLWHRSRIDTLRIAALLLGLAVPAALILTAISMNYRYRMEFHPLLECAAFAATILLADAPDISAPLRRAIIAAAALCIAGTFASLLLYKLSRYGPAELYLQDGIVEYYARALAQRAFR